MGGGGRSSEIRESQKKDNMESGNITIFLEKGSTFD